MPARVCEPVGVDVHLFVCMRVAACVHVFACVCVRVCVCAGISTQSLREPGRAQGSRPHTRTAQRHTAASSGVHSQGEALLDCDDLTAAGALQTTPSLVPVLNSQDEGGQGALSLISSIWFQNTTPSDN